MKEKLRGQPSLPADCGDRIKGMKAKPVQVQKVGWTDLPAVTRMTFDNMIGVDRYFTRMVRNPLGRWLTYGTLPLYLRFSGIGFKALVNGRLAGCAFLHVRGHSGYIFNVSVNRAYRRQGIGRKLMAHMERVIMARSREWSVLQVDRGNEPAEQLYRQLGYRSYHPHFLRREIRPPISKAMTGGMTIERLHRRLGHHLYARYLNIERRKGDFWAASVVDEYDSRPGAGGAYWRCQLYKQEIGCARVIGREDRPLIRLALNPEYWGHVATGGLAKELVDSLSGRPDYVDLFLESSAHHRAACRILNGLGFQERCRSRLLMLKPLVNGDLDQPAADGQAD